MFTIDLLNGQGLPLKTRPGGLVIVAVTAVLPILLAIGTVSFYLHNKVILSLKEGQIEKSKAMIDKYSDAMEQREALLKEKTVYDGYLSEIGSSIKDYTQWSPVLTTVVETMPDSVTLSSFEVERKSVKKKIPDKKNPENTKEIDVPYRVVQISVQGSAQKNCDEDVRGFQDRLRTSALLGPKLDDIRVSKNSETTIEGQDVFSYEITCVLKPRL